MSQIIQTWDHQKPAIEFLNSNPNTLLDCIMGGGKTYMQIQNIKHVASAPMARTLVLCPPAVFGVWLREFFLHAPEQFNVLILDRKTSVYKAERLYEALKVQQSNRLPLVVVINYESFYLKMLWKVLNSVIWDKMICDESHRIKGPRAKCSVNAWRLGKRAGSKTALTGTPMPQGPQDIFAQYRWLDSRIFGVFWGQFKNEYARMNKYIPNAVDEWINLDAMNEKINRIRYHIPKSVLVLPEKQHITIEVDLAPAGRKAYNEMKKESIAFIKKAMMNHEEDEIRTIIGSNGGVRFLRLLQLAQGYATDDEGEEINTDTEKRRALLDLIQDAGEPVVVYGWFKHDLACIERCCDIAGLRYGELSGRRKDITSHAKMREDIDVMGVQCKSGSAGIDLTRSRIGIVLNSGLLSPGDYDQMLARQYRPGQTKNVVFYHLVTKNTVETKLMTDRGKKRDLIDVLLAEIQWAEIF